MTDRSRVWRASRPSPGLASWRPLRAAIALAAGLCAAAAAAADVTPPGWSRQTQRGLVVLRPSADSTIAVLVAPPSQATGSLERLVAEKARSMLPPDWTRIAESAPMRIPNLHLTIDDPWSVRGKPFLVSTAGFLRPDGSFQAVMVTAPAEQADEAKKRYMSALKDLVWNLRSGGEVPIDPPSPTVAPPRRPSASAGRGVRRRAIGG